MAREYFPAYHSYLEVMEALTDAEKGRLFTACLLYSKTGEVPKLSGNERFVFPAFRSQIDRDNAEYAKKCATNRKNGELGGKRTGANVGERTPNAPQGKGEGKGKGEGEGESSPDGDDARTRDPAVAAVMEAYMNRIDPTPSPSSMDELKGYVQLMGPECCIRAIDAALNAKAATWNYIRRVLQSKASQGVRCIADWNALEARREEQKRGGVQSAGADAGGTFHGWRAKSALDDAD